jgi:hypothetical protein
MIQPLTEILVGMPVDVGCLPGLVLKYVPPAGAIQMPCERCSQPAWQGPHQQAYLRTHPPTEFICAICLAAQMKNHAAEVAIGSCGGAAAGGSIFLADGRAFLPSPPKEN